MIKIFNFLIEVWGWIKIVLSPLTIGLVLGTIIYGSNQNGIGLAIGIAVSLLGLVIGIIWATRVWKTRGTNNFLSEIYRTPELDSNKEEESLKR